MSQRDNFAVGFLAGTIVGGVVGGIVGSVLAFRGNRENEEGQRSLLKFRKAEPLDSEESIEIARRTLEEKIAQLNLAIDDVRQQLGSVNGGSSEAE